MFLPTDASRRQIREAENARNNRREIVAALSHKQITRRDLFRWGLLTTTGALVAKNGLSRWATSAYAQVPTGSPRSPTFGVKKFTQAMRRPHVELPARYNQINDPMGDTQLNGQPVKALDWGHPNELPARRLSWHNNMTANAYKNPVTGFGPVEGRPPTEFFAHQRWNQSDLTPKHGYILSLGQIADNSRFHPGFPAQDKNSVWTFGARPVGAVGNKDGVQYGNIAPTLIKARYGEPFVCRIYNDVPDDPTKNNGFGRNEISTHLHNAHNGAESDGACNAYHFPGTFYDYHWGMTLARRDLPSVWLPNTQNRACGPDDGDGYYGVPGDFREIQSSLWFHDHRFFFTAENVHKGHYALMNVYSGPDRARESLNDGINLKLPSGAQLSYGNTDFDVNLVITNPAFDQAGQLFFDVFDTEGYLGDVMAVNNTYYPFMQVLPRRYRFRTLNAAMARFIKLAIVINKSTQGALGTKIPMYFIANDGNFIEKPILLTELDEQGVAERYDFVVDFSKFKVGDSLYLINLLQQTDGRKPDGIVSVATALKGVEKDPCVGPIMEFRIVDSLPSVDSKTPFTYTPDAVTGKIRDDSVNFDTPEWKTGTKKLTEQIPVVTPVRTRTISFGRSGDGDSRVTPDGNCIPDCGEIEAFPWTIKVEGRAGHSLNANRISALVPKPGEVEHWVLVNGGGGWDHPIHLHFEEAVTISRTGRTIHPTERLARKDVWRLGLSGSVKIQVRFGEYGGAYVAHCHNTTHEDFAMLMRVQLLTQRPGTAGYTDQPQWLVTKTPIPSRTGVTWMTPEILPEGDPNNPEFKKRSA